MLSKDAVIDSLSSRITKDIADALDHVDVHEIIGILEMIKISVVTQTLASSATAISDAVIGDNIVH
jgi:hypothetical protein